MPHDRTPQDRTRTDSAIAAATTPARDQPARVPARRHRVVTRQLVVIDDTGLQVIPDGFDPAAAAAPARPARHASRVDQCGFLVGHVRLG